MSYGIMRDLKGDIQIESRPGLTRVDLLLPPAADGNGKGAGDGAHTGPRRRQVFRKSPLHGAYPPADMTSSLPLQEEALSNASASPFDAAIIDMMMPGMNGFEVLSRLRVVRPATACIILTGYGSIADAVTAMKLGGYNYLTKPCSIDEIESARA
ncbi:MAG: response regulator [Deltaproteobacteria bacterium]|nr:response regulator [Deltaproteobacteria bacterium]